MEKEVMEYTKNYCDIPLSKCSLAMAYVPWQNWEAMYKDEQALNTGTVFPSLNLPFCGEGIIK